MLNLPTDILRDLGEEIDHADKRYGEFTSSHEGLGVLMEEFDELRHAIRLNDTGSIEEEAIQMAAVALRIARSMRNPAAVKRSVR